MGSFRAYGVVWCGMWYVHKNDLPFAASLHPMPAIAGAEPCRSHARSIPQAAEHWTYTAASQGVPC